MLGTGGTRLEQAVSTKLPAVSIAIDRHMPLFLARAIVISFMSAPMKKAIQKQCAARTALSRWTKPAKHATRLFTYVFTVWDLCPAANRG